MFKNKSLLIIALIALVNMLGYGVIIPLLYGYSKKFGLSDFENGMLFASFSVCQFLATPIIGRLSDKYGRRPMLLLSITGTAISFFTMAWAPNALFLFIARAFDGLTAGNIPVAFAVISDTTEPAERPKAFGLIGAAFNFGFVFGPAIAALTLGFGQTMPFIIAGGISVMAVILTAIFLPETNKHLGEVKQAKLFDLPKIWHTLFDPNVGVTFLISLIFFMAFSCAIIYGFQPFTLNVLHISQTMNATLFTVFGALGLISQVLLVQKISQILGMKRAFSTGIALTLISFIIMFISTNLTVFIIAMIILGFFNTVVGTLIPTILSREADAKSQGSIMGLNASYQSIGMIIGPLLGGFVATYSPRYPFAVGAVFVLLCFYLSFKVLRPGVKKESAFSS